MKTVLVVEDDPAIAGFLSIILQKQGYHVLHASDIAEADAILAEKKSELSCVITDGMGPQSKPGLALASRIHVLNPSLPVVLVTGNPRPEHWRGHPKERFMQKPFSRQALLAIVDELAA